MSKKDLPKTKLKEHINALEEHRALIEELNEADSSINLNDIKRSLERLAITLEEYFKVIGIP